MPHRVANSLEIQVVGDVAIFYTIVMTRLAIHNIVTSQKRKHNDDRSNLSPLYQHTSPLSCRLVCLCGRLVCIFAN